MAATGVVETIDVLEDGSFRLTPRWPALPPNEFRLQGLKNVSTKALSQLLPLPLIDGRRP